MPIMKNILMFEFEGDSIEEVSKYCQDTVKEITEKNYASKTFTAVLLSKYAITNALYGFLRITLKVSLVNN